MIKKYSNFIFENVKVQGGRSIFISFLKGISALGLKNMNKVENKDYLFLYKTNLTDVDKLKSIFYRFKSLTMFTNLVDNLSNCELYYGIKSDMSFDYGFSTVNSLIPIGKFKITKNIFSWLKLLQSPSANILKTNIVSLDINDLILFSKINNVISTFDIKSEQFSGPTIKGDIITYGYYGVGKWDISKLDETEHNSLKSKFKDWLSKYKWSDKILVNVTYKSYWIYDLS
jgi:hypothetical protein